MLGEHAPDDVLVEVDAEGVGELLSDSPAAEAGIALLHREDGGNELRRRAFRARNTAPLRREQQLVLALHESPVKRQDRGGFQHDGDAPESCGADPLAAQRGDQPIGELEVRGSFTAAVQNQQLLSQHQRFGDERSCTAWPKESRDRRQEVDQQNREIAHADIVVTRAILARLEIATIGAKNCEFATQSCCAIRTLCVVERRLRVRGRRRQLAKQLR